jgi:hypothetical protein
MNGNKRQAWIVAGIGAAFVIGLLTLSHIYTPSPDITTPEQDALVLSLKAQTIRTEEDLRNLEKMAYEYEIAYKHSYGGAKAMYFKKLMEPVIIAAGDRREAIRAEEDVLAEAQRVFHTTLEDVDIAWRMELGSSDEVLAAIAKNDESIAALEQKVSQLELQKQELGAKAWSGPSGSLDQDCLKEIGKVESNIEKCQQEILEYEHQTRIIELAYRLQRGEMPAVEEPAVEQYVVEEPVEADLCEW